MSKINHSEALKATTVSRMRLLQISSSGAAKINWVDLLQPARKQLATSPEFHENLAIVTHFKSPRPGNPGIGESLYVVSNTESRGPSFANKSQILEKGRLTRHMTNWLACTAMSHYWDPDLNDFLPLMQGKPFDRESLRSRVMQATFDYNLNILDEIRISGLEKDPSTELTRQNAYFMLQTIHSMGYWPETGTSADFAE
ncbi:MAG TPA: hypothetical protein VN778_01430 [Verrucomicrobiae bacterium]|nr:hypothetical protein [Verrucomicrobiae bacterium]